MDKIKSLLISGLEKLVVAHPEIIEGLVEKFLNQALSHLQANPEVVNKIVEALFAQLATKVQ